MPCEKCGRRLFTEMNEEHWKQVFQDQRLNRLLVAAQALSPPNVFDPDWADIRPPAVRVIDCVISANRAYLTFVKPRLDDFQDNCPNVCTIRQLEKLISKYATPLDFMKETLNYKHEARANTLSAVVNWLVDIAGDGQADEQLQNLQEWARAAQPSDFAALDIAGFKLASFQYLRILFRACTVKPDVHVRDFFRNAVGRSSDLSAVTLLERLAAGVGLCAAQLDLAIWESRANLAAAV